MVSAEQGWIADPPPPPPSPLHPGEEHKWYRMMGADDPVRNPWHKKRAVVGEEIP